MLPRMRRFLPFLMVGVLTSCGSTASSTTTASPAPTVPPSTTAPVATTTGTPTTTVAPTTTDAPVEPNLVEIQVSGSTVVGGGKVSISLGEEATIRVVSDTADEAHLHGYDLYVDLVPNVPAEFVFVASIPGVFELEFEESGLLLAEIEVS